MMAARWADVERDLASSVRHYRMAVVLFDAMMAVEPGRDKYPATMAFLHAMLAGYTLFETGLKRILAVLDEPAPTGSEWHKDLVARLANEVPGSRPAFIDGPDLRKAIFGLLGFRHIAAHVYDEFDEDRAALAVANAETFLAGIGQAVTRFRAVIDPD